MVGHIRKKNGNWEARFPVGRHRKIARSFPTKLEANLWLAGMCRGEDLCGKKDGMVYALWPEGLPYLKIGVTTDLEKRLSDLQFMCPVTLHVIFLMKSRLAWPLERYIHRELAEFRLHGEWFARPCASALISLLEAAT